VSSLEGVFNLATERTEVRFHGSPDVSADMSAQEYQQHTEKQGDVDLGWNQRSGRGSVNSATSTTPSDQKPREEKSAPYRDARYPLLLQTKGSYMDISELGITDVSEHFVRDLLRGEQPAPKETLFDDDIFVDACRHLENKNKARIIQDISRLIVPSAESIALRNKNYKHLVESVNEGWNNSVPLTSPRPQPDYSVGFRQFRPIWRLVSGTPG
jgi:hypothetical protein